jgi:hypothetical protein
MSRLKTLIFFFAFLLLSGKLGKQSLRFRASKTFFFGITVFGTRTKIQQTMTRLETILCFPEQLL